MAMEQICYIEISMYSRWYFSGIYITVPSSFFSLVNLNFFFKVGFFADPQNTGTVKYLVTD